VFQEMAYTVTGGSAESQAAGVSVNMIPRTGGNTYTYEFLGTLSNNTFQSTNIDDELRQAGLNATVGGLDKLWDANANVGGPIIRDRLWFFGSASSRVTTSRRIVFCTSTTGVSPDTVTVSAIAPTRISAFTGAVKFASSTTPSRLTVLNPASVNVTA